MLPTCSRFTGCRSSDSEARSVYETRLLQSAVAQPQATFGDTFLHSDLIEMAGAYLFHLVGNHPFVDGNKRVGLASALVFLDLNGIVVRTHTEELYELTMRVARGALKKREVVEVLGEIVGRE